MLFRSFSFSNWFILAILVIGVLAPFLANDKPIISIQNHNISFPFFSNEKYLENTAAFEVWPLIPYHSQSLDFKNMNSVGPFEEQVVPSLYYRHWLGTDELGRDLLAGLIHGCHTAIWVGFGAMAIALIIGVFLGGIAGYFGDSTYRIHKAKWISCLAFLLLTALFIPDLIPWDWAEIPFIEKATQTILFTMLFLFLSAVLYFILNRFQAYKKSISIPVDLIISRCIEIMETIPLLFLIIALSAIFSPSYWSLIGIIGISSWTSIARFMRAEVLKIRQKDYVESGFALGLSNIQIMKNHVLPNALNPIYINLSFGIAAAILIEATLSFLGLGMGVEQVSWGSILASSRADYTSWWLAVYPGVLLFLTLYSLNQIGDKLSK